MIKIANIYKSYGQTEVLKGIHLNIEKGSKYGLIGRSGTGKSTLLRCINGLEDYNSGSLKVKDVEVKNLNKDELRDLGKNKRPRKYLAIKTPVEVYYDTVLHLV